VLGRVLEPGSAAPRAGYRIFLGSQNIMVLQGLDTPIGTEEVVSIVAPAGLSN
jgi:hypothetical protein